MFISEVLVNTAVWSPEAAILSEDVNNLPSIDTICLPNLIIFAVPTTFPWNKGLWKEICISVEGRLFTFSGKIAATGLHTAVLTKTSDINKSQ